MRFLVAAVALSLALGCEDFEQARVDYEAELQRRAVVPELKKVLGEGCLNDVECKSGFCTDGFCRDGQAGPNQTCSSAGDCQSGLFCEPAADLYVCLQPQCAAVGRLCQGDFACGGVGCLALKCRDGLCGPPTCAEGAACGSSGECCDGFGCTPDGGCSAAAEGQFPVGFRCSSAVQCQSGECGGSGRCIESTGSCAKVSESCSNSCCDGVECSPTSGQCCLANARVCTADAQCCSGQCLDGICAQQSACRQHGLPCSEGNDCCAGKCDAARRCAPFDAGS